MESQWFPKDIIYTWCFFYLMSVSMLISWIVTPNFVGFKSKIFESKITIFDGYVESPCWIAIPQFLIGKSIFLMVQSLCLIVFNPYFWWLIHHYWWLNHVKSLCVIGKFAGNPTRPGMPPGFPARPPGMPPGEPRGADIGPTCSAENFGISPKTSTKQDR